MKGKKKGNKDMASFQSFQGLTLGSEQSEIQTFSYLEKSNRTCLLRLGKICVNLIIEMIFKVTLKQTSEVYCFFALQASASASKFFFFCASAATSAYA